MLQTLIATESLTDMMQTLVRFKDTGVKPDVITFNTILVAFREAKNVFGVTKTYQVNVIGILTVQLMLKEKITPDMITCNTLIAVFVQSKQYPELVSFVTTKMRVISGSNTHVHP